MLTRVAGVCALLALVATCVAMIAGGLAQPDAYSFANDDVSDLGALTANSAWIYNQVGANLTGLLVAVVGLALWQALSPDVLGRLGAAALTATGISYFFDGVFRLDCRGIDPACQNVSWHAHAHKLESRVSAALILATPFVLAFAFRRNAGWRDAWVPTLVAVPVAFVVGAAFSAIGNGAAVRATTITWMVWLAFIGVRLLQKGRRAPAADAGPG